jgi:FkbM family methyltransferase
MNIIHKVVKKARSLSNLNILALLRFIKKRTWHKIEFFKAKLKGIKSYPVKVGDVTIDLYFHAPYHHMRAKAFSEGDWDEIELLPEWVEEARKSRLVFDVGGYNGIYGLLAAKANPSAKVLIFEPDPINAEHIRQNVAKNYVNCTIIEAAVSDDEGSVKFSGSGGTGSKIVDWGALEVKTVRLSMYGSPDLLKIDVEGHEPEALRGANISNTKTIFVEMNHDLLPFLKGYKEVARSEITAVFKR